MPLALEVQHRVHDVLHDLRACDSAVLVHVTHKNHRNFLAFRGLHEQAGALPHLGDAAGGGGDSADAHGLYGVDYGYIRRAGGYSRRRRLRVRGSQQVEVFGVHTQPLGAELYLPCRLLAGDVENGVIFAKKLAYLQQYRAFSDARLAAQQDERAFYKSAAQDAVQFADARVVAHVGVPADVRQLQNIVAEVGNCRRRCSSPGRGDGLPQGLLQGVP